MRTTTRRGLLLTVGIVTSWVGSLVLLLPTHSTDLPPVAQVLAILVRTVLQTGLFIVAHDAMHGTLWPERPGANRWIGQMALLLYAALPWERCLGNHRNHHRHPGTCLDPDHHAEGQPGFIAWYGRFMAGYLSPSQISALVIGWLAIGTLTAWLSASPLINVLLYCTLPTLLSSLQLFLVGTFIPHRSAGQPLSAPEMHVARSLNLPGWLSLLSCYHFGYHWEHHAFPDLAWHALPEARRRVKDGFNSPARFALP